MKCYCVIIFSLTLFWKYGVAKEVVPSEVYHWNKIKYIPEIPSVNYDTNDDRITGIEVFGDSGLFVTINREKNFGQPNNATLAMSAVNFVSRRSITPNKSPQLLHYAETKLFHFRSASRATVDRCYHLWFVDTEASKLVVIDLQTDKVIREKILEPGTGSLFGATVVTDANPENCNDSYAYVSTMRGSTIFVYTLETDQYWVFDNVIPPDYAPAGIASLALHEIYLSNSKTLYIQQHRSPNLFSITTDTLKSPHTIEEKRKRVKFLGAVDSLKAPPLRTIANVIFFSKDNSILFYTAGDDSVGCWNFEKYPDEFSANTTAVIKLVNVTDGVITDLMTDGASQRGINIQDAPPSYFNNLWILKTNPKRTDPSQPFDQAVYRINVRELVNGTACQLPQYTVYDPFGRPLGKHPVPVPKLS